MARIIREGTVISGTLSPEDLIPAFMEELDDVVEEMAMTRDPSEYGLSTPLWATINTLNKSLGEIEGRMQDSGYFISEEADWDLEYLFDILDSLAPTGYHFSAHEGDGSDFGYWPNEDDENSENDDENDDENNEENPDDSDREVYE